jgi:catechol 2,3-dioxygenase-like lactoylglutathione lyase family enzyme
MTITGFDHYTIRCADLRAAWHFYEQVLGLRVVERPGVSVPAAIVYLDEMMLIHLFQASPAQEEIFARFDALDPEAAEWATGRLHHIAFQARGVEDFRARLTANGSSFTERTLASLGKHLIVLEDLDGVEIELAFPIPGGAASPTA